MEGTFNITLNVLFDMIVFVKYVRSNL